MKKIIVLILMLFSFIPKTYAKDNIVNIYLFHSRTCMHCQAEIDLLNDLEKQYPNIRIYKYEVSNKDNARLFNDVAELMGTKVSGVPFTIIGDKYYVGFSHENTKKEFMGAINYFSDYSYEDKVGEYIGNTEILDNDDIDEDKPTYEEYMKDYGNHTLSIPIIGEVSTKDIALPIVTIIIGLLDGFNPCAMWVLLFLITMLVGMKDHKKMIILGSTFILTSGIIYFLLMNLWLDLSKMIINITLIRSIIGLIAIVCGLYNLIHSLNKNTKGCNIVKDTKRTKILDKIKKFTKEKNLLLSIVGVITLAISVNIIELACSAGLPLMYTEILALNNLSNLTKILYILLYIVFFLLDDFIVFFIAVFTLKVVGISNRFTKIFKVISSLILLILGILLIFFPNIVMLNF